MPCLSIRTGRGLLHRCSNNTIPVYWDKFAVKRLLKELKNEELPTDWVQIVLREAEVPESRGEYYVYIIKLEKSAKNSAQRKKC